MAEYKFELAGDYQAKLAEMSGDGNVIKINPLTATKSEFACYLMYLMTENAKNIGTLTTSMNALQGEVTSLKDKVTDLEAAATAKDEECSELRKDLDAANLKIEEQGRDIKHLMKRMDIADQNCLDLERHSRSSNVRIGGIGETPNEDCKAKVTAVFEGVDLDNIDIENCHRVGEKKADQTRYMIVRFVRRTQRRDVLAKRKDLFDSGHPIYEDLPYKDLVVKKKFKKEIDAHFKNKDKVYFSRGAWYVNHVKKYW